MRAQTYESDMAKFYLTTCSFLAKVTSQQIKDIFLRFFFCFTVTHNLDTQLKTVR